MSTGNDESLAPQNQYFVYKGIKFKKTTYDYERLAEMIPNLEMRESDVLVASHVKTGTHWLKYILTLLVLDGDKQALEKKYLGDHVEFLELDNNLITGRAHQSNSMIVERWKNKASPRLFNTHLHWQCAPRAVQEGKVKVILQVRNPKDVVNSMYPFFTSTKMYEPFRGTLEDFVQCMMKGDLPYGCGTYPSMYKSWWEHREDMPLLVVHYEDMKRDLEKEIGRIADFMGKQVTPKQVQSIAELSSIENMRKCPSTQPLESVLMDKGGCPFFRKGVVGDWKEGLPVEITNAIGEWVDKELEGTGFCYKTK